MLIVRKSSTILLFHLRKQPVESSSSSIQTSLLNSYALMMYAVHHPTVNGHISHQQK